MSNVTVSNSIVGNNPDIPVRTTTLTGTGQNVQHMRIDFGTGGAESVVSLTNPLPVSATFSGSITADTNTPVSTVTTEANVTITGASTPILAANANRVGGYIKNIGNANVYVSFSATAATSKPTLCGPGAAVTLSGSGWVYTGDVAGITAGSSVDVEVVEL